jgi:hypothetical protein
VDLEKFFSRLVALVMRAKRPRAVRAVAINGEAAQRSMERIFMDILEEQRRTRILLERLVSSLEGGGAFRRSAGEALSGDSAVRDPCGPLWVVRGGRCRGRGIVDGASWP